MLRSRRVEGRLEFEVEDNGPGIDKGDLPYIFEKFYRGKKGAKLGKGTGMGLAIARALMLAHGGGHHGGEHPEHGCIFRFWVPLVEKDRSAEKSNRRVDQAGSLLQSHSTSRCVSAALLCPLKHPHHPPGFRRRDGRSRGFAEKKHRERLRRKADNRLPSTARACHHCSIDIDAERAPRSWAPRPNS